MHLQNAQSGIWEQNPSFAAISIDNQLVISLTLKITPNSVKDWVFLFNTFYVILLLPQFIYKRL